MTPPASDPDVLSRVRGSPPGGDLATTDVLCSFPRWEESIISAAYCQCIRIQVPPTVGCKLQLRFVKNHAFLRGSDL
jgi:hypothetical protein